MNRQRTILGFMLGLALTNCAAQHALAQVGTAFTWQGRLLDGGAPVNGSADLRFRLYNIESGGVLLAPEVVTSFTGIFPDPPIVDGMVAIELDFGSVFFGGDRWLEVAVRAPHDPSDTAPYTTLTPRQPILPTPYAMHADFAETVSPTAVPFNYVGSDAVFTGGHVGINTLTPQTALHVENSGDSSAIFGHAMGANEAGIEGGASGGGFSVGVRGSSLSPTGAGMQGTGFVGVVGQSFDSSGKGVHGIAADPSGWAGYFEGDRNYFEGDVGIGTSGPTQKLDVRGDVLIQGVPWAISGDESTLYLGDTNHSMRSIVGTGVRISTYQAPDAIAVQETTGNVGIGIVNPLSRLHVYNDETVLFRAFNSGAGGTRYAIDAQSHGTFGSTIVSRSMGATGATHAVRGDNVSDNGTGVAGFATATTGNTTGVMGISSSPEGQGVYGRALAATGSGIAVLGDTFSENGRAIYGVAMSATGTNFGVYGQTESDDGYAGYFVGGRNFFQNDVGIGTFNPLARLHIQHPAIGTGWGVRIHNASESIHKTGMRVSDDGFFDVTNHIDGFTGFARLDSTGAWTIASDRRVKEDIEPMTGLLSKTMQLNPVSFWYTRQDREQLPEKQIGFVAQEVDAVFPSLVTHGDDLLTMNYGGLSAVAVGAVQELKREKDQQIAALQERIVRFERQLRERDAELTALHARLTALEAK